MVSDDIVFEAKAAGEREVMAWTVIKHIRGGPVIIHDMKRGFDNPFDTGSITKDVSYEKYDFSTETMAQEYIRWRGTKVVIETALALCKEKPE